MLVFHCKDQEIAEYFLGLLHTYGISWIQEIVVSDGVYYVIDEDEKIVEYVYIKDFDEFFGGMGLDIIELDNKDFREVCL